MKFFDLSHRLDDKTPVYPGKTQPSFRNIADIDSDGYREKHLSLDSHVGTHIDAPAHMLASGKTLDQFPVSKFTGPALVLEIPDDIKTITTEFLEQFYPEFYRVKFILFKTGWYSRWGDPSYLEDFPVLENSAVDKLAEFNLNGIGFDTISVDPVSSADWPIHHRLFSKDMVIIENMTFPVEIPSLGIFYCIPLKIENADGSPIRAVFQTS